MKNQLVLKSLLGLAFLLFLSGCMMPRYGHRGHGRNERHENRHHRNHNPGVEVRIHN